MTVYCLIERDALGHQRVLCVYTDYHAACRRLVELMDSSDGRHWYRVETTSMEDAA